MTTAHDTAAPGDGSLARALNRPGQMPEDTSATTEKSPWSLGNGKMAQRIRCHAWASTPLGPIEAWPQRLWAVVKLILASPLVSSVVCRSGHVLLYNDAAARLYGDRHPQALGRPLPETFPDGWPVVEPLQRRVFASEFDDRSLAFDYQFLGNQPGVCQAHRVPHGGGQDHPRPGRHVGARRKLDEPLHPPL